MVWHAVSPPQPPPNACLAKDAHAQRLHYTWEYAHSLLSQRRSTLGGEDGSNCLPGGFPVLLNGWGGSTTLRANEEGMSRAGLWRIIKSLLRK